MMQERYFKRILDGSTLMNLPDLETETISEDFEIINEDMRFTINGTMNITFDVEDETIDEDFGLGTETMVIGYLVDNVDVVVTEVTMFDNFLDDEIGEITSQHERQIEQFIKTEINF